MSLVDDVSAELKTAMRAKDKPRVQALRSIRAAFIEAMKAEGADGALADDKALTILRRLGKQRRESIEAYRAGDRPDLAEIEQGELAVIETFLPAVADQDQTRAWVQAAIDQTGASSPSDLGRVMGVLMKDHKGVIDGKLANKLARELLA